MMIAPLTTASGSIVPLFPPPDFGNLVFFVTHQDMTQGV